MRVTQPFTNFIGLNMSSAIDSLLPTELITADNIIFDVRGGYSKGWGRVRHTPNPLDANPVKRIIPHFKKDGTVQLFYSSGTTLWKANGSTATAIKTDLAGEIKDYFSWTDDKLYFLDGTNYYRTDGTMVEAVPPFDTNYDLAGVKRCTMHEWYPGWFRHFFAGDSQDKYAVWFSDDSDPQKVKSGASGTAKVHPTLNLGPVTGLKVWKNHVLVGYKNGWFKWYGGGTNVVISADWHLLPASSGPVNNRVIVPVREYLCYCADDGVYVLETLNVSAEDNARKISKKIDPLYKSLTNKENLSATFDGRWLKICAPSDNLVLVADFDIVTTDENGDWSPAWSVQRDVYANDIIHIDGVTYFGHSQNGLVMKFDENVVNNDDQPLIWKAEHYVSLRDKYGTVNPFALHRVKSFLMALKQFTAEATCKVTVQCDYVSKKVDVQEVNESFSWGAEWGKIWGLVSYSNIMGKINEKAKRIKITIENDKLNEPFTLLAWGLEYKPGKTKSKRKLTGVKI